MMKTLKLALGIVFFSLIFWSCKDDPKPEIKTIEITKTKTKTESPIDKNVVLAKAEFKIDGMTCAVGCAKTIEKKLSKMEGVTYALVDFESKTAEVEYNEAKVTPSSLEKTVIKASEQYIVSEMKTVKSFSSEPLKEDKKTS